MDKIQLALQLREEANRLEKEAHNERPLPKKWKVGQRVRFLESKEWAWYKGSEAIIVELSPECKHKSAEEYQVFWTSPCGGGATWWTTPDDVELLEDNAR